ncbi:PTS mannose/fructose/sorbose/N-acetylgalactosamine transporter subunit IIC [Clostridium coskatii]|uniref:N-acetylgalactosamine permease IIC component 1 n=1 Tax=Clostridium coskatii TaxID=1705578 RepID=A0A166T365_9CLOT|nr:PTS sugar transporter subunit IIC [Clostridium coskatii]OAA93124.1 N-acetylgalactosamine permease IIC component 1 [Clostridium coskatii]OBR90867.1 N-acetylgalactosamine permease IIC component 1 [Clostridium coskatii]
MHGLALWQILILTIYASYSIIDGLGISTSASAPLFAGFFTGFILGDIKMGLVVGATLQLMVLGVATYGGSSVPDFMSAAIIGTAFAIISHQKVAFAIGVAVPIGLLLTQMDILARLSNIFFQHKADKYAEDGNADGVSRMNLLCISTWAISRGLPVFLGLFFGNAVVKAINLYIPNWLMGGLKVSGAILPAMGIAILMRYLSLKKYYAFYILGFVLVAYGKIPMMGVALVGFAIAAIYLMLKKEIKPVLSDGGDIDD